MKRLLTVVITTMLTAAVYATPVYHPLGANLSYGDISNGQTIMSNITNPAAGAAVLKNNTNQYRFGILSSIGAGVEYGSIDNLFDEIDGQINQFFGINPEVIINPADAVNEIGDAIDSLNSTLTNLEKNGFGKVFASVHVPLMPIVVSTDWLGGSVVFDANFSFASRAEVLHTNIIFNRNNLEDNTDDISYTLNTNTFRVKNDDTLLVRGAATAEIALGYSRLALSTKEGNLYGGIRGKFYRVGLTQLNVRLGDVENSEDLFNDIGDEDFTDDTGFGLDIGLLWKSQHYRAGATLTNINEPEFEYNNLNNTEDYNTAGPIFQRLLSKLNYVMESQLKLEGALFSHNQHWVLGAGFDANAVKDPFGDEYQWATISAAYASPGWIIPAVRAGYRVNLSGSELSYLTFGSTLFKVFNIDLAYGLEEVVVDGDTFPRSLIVNLGLEITI
ncbi:MAG: conjugal transfer protein TraF [Gammaproteobacteria bacterium]|nr:conjugal transfer protein TraF [Gammaproteobacteria bacterium]